MLFFCGTHHLSQYIANSSASCCTVRSACTTYTRESDRFNSSAPCDLAGLRALLILAASSVCREPSERSGKTLNFWRNISYKNSWTGEALFPPRNLPIAHFLTDQRDKCYSKLGLQISGRNVFVMRCLLRQIVLYLVPNRQNPNPISERKYSKWYPLAPGVPV